VFEYDYAQNSFWLSPELEAMIGANVRGRQGVPIR